MKNTFYISILIILFSFNGVFSQTLSVNELITNGDFESGDISGFQTDYWLAIPFENGGGEGSYSVLKDPKVISNSYRTQYDHTTGSSYMFFVNSDTLPNKIVIKKRITNLEKNAEYSLSFWYSLNGPLSHGWFPRLGVYVNDVKIEQFDCENLEWRQYKYIYNTGDLDYIDFYIINEDLRLNPYGNASGMENDFALDDFSFRKVCQLEINMPDEITICKGDIGRFEVELTGATQNEGFMWTAAPGLHEGHPASPWVNPTETTTYHLLVLEEGGCEIRDSIKVNVVPPPDVEIAISKPQPVLCPCESMTLTASGGNTYLWEDGSVAAQRIIDKQGTYTVTATNEIGCSNTKSIEVTYESFELNVTLDTLSVEIGKKFSFPVTLSINQTGDNCSIQDYKLKLSYRKSLLVPVEIDNDFTVNSSDETFETIELVGHSAQGNLQRNINFIPTLGDEVCTEIKTEVVDLNCPSIAISSNSGKICLSNVCSEPTDRLFKETNGRGLAQNFPNPANKSTQINYSLTGDGFAEIEIYNYLGESIAKPVNEFKKFGEYVLTLNTKEFPNGVYYYVLRTNKDVFTRTMIIAND